MKHPCPGAAPDAARARRWRAPGLALLSALGLHAALLEALPWPDRPALASAPPHPPASGMALRVRLYAGVAAPSTQARPTPAPTTAAAARRPSPTPAALVSIPTPTRHTAGGPAPAPTQTEPPPLIQPTLARALPAGQWHYRFTLGDRQGLARLLWQAAPEGGPYVLRLQRRYEDGRELEEWISRGSLGASGLSPERFATAREGRERQATNFSRDAGRLSYSASTEQLPLPEGVQDRLSAWLQLAAMAEARPGGLQTGERLLLPLASLRGPVLPWEFLVRGRVVLRLADGSEWPALHLDGASRALPASRLELWLGSTQGHLPLRLRWSWDGQARSELLLISATEAPDS